MDNHHLPSLSNTTIADSIDSKVNVNSTNFQYYPLMPQPPPPFYGNVWFGTPNGDGYFHQPNMLIEQEKRALNAYRTKLARNHRKIARQKSLSKINPSSSSSSDARKHVVLDCDRVNIQFRNTVTDMDLYLYCTPDNKRLRLLLKKELKNSDVGGLGRIVLPKREAELNLPPLSDKEGIYIVIRDIFSSQQWKMKFKFWCNNKSRMYVLENTGAFVRQNKMEMGDNLHLYEDESKNLYFAVEKTGRAVDTLPDHSQNNHVPVSQVKDEEEAASLSLLIEQLKHSAQEETYSLMPLSITSYASNDQADTNSMEMQYVDGKARVIDDDQHEDGCCLGFSMLNDVNSTYI